jgi:hypothetical protein
LVVPKKGVILGSPAMAYIAPLRISIGQWWRNVPRDLLAVAPNMMLPREKPRQRICHLGSVA